MKVFKPFCSLFVALLFFSCQQESKPTFFIIQGEAQGSTYAIKYIATEEVTSKTEIDSLLTAFDLSLSTYRPDSKISKINAGDSTIVVDDFFLNTFEVSSQIFQETNGLFDPTIGVLVNAYGFGPNKILVTLSQSQIDSTLQYVGFDKVKLNQGKTVSKQFKQTIRRNEKRLKKEKSKKGQPYFEARIGVHTGPLVAGVVGSKKFAYDVWGDTVNVAARMESAGEVNKINISRSTHSLVSENKEFVFENRGEHMAKNKGKVTMIVNVTGECANSAQYIPIQKLHDECRISLKKSPDIHV